MVLSKELKKLHQIACISRKKSSSPYSKFKVGCSLKANGNYYSGTNIENASYGATLCAERVAIFKAISDGKKNISEIIIVINSKKPGYPCAFCLQVMAEFCTPRTNIYLANTKKITHHFKFHELLPYPFSPKNLI